MAKAGYVVKTGAAVGLVAATAKTVLMVLAPAQFGIDLKKVRIAFDGVTATAVPVYIEIVSSTNATNSTPGTGNTTATVNQVYGRTITAGFTAFYNSSAEPTVLTSIDEVPLLDPNKGLFVYDWPLGDTPDSAVSAGLGLRMTAPAAVNVRAALYFERC
jgi:hypothetical protein